MSGAGGGSSKISLALNGRAKPTNGVKRSHAAALQDEDEEESQYGRSETVSHFDRKTGGAFDEKTKKDEGPLIIQRQANRDWKVEAERKRKRQKNGLPDGADGQGTEERMREVEERDAMKKPGLGLNLYKKESGDGEGAVEEEEQVVEGTPVQEEPPPRQKTEDELAIDALLGRTTHDKSLTIAATEEEVFQNDVQSAPEMASLDDYARVPVEQFGAALLRGMGWKDGEGIGSQKGKKLPKDVNKLPERRANLLGIGAKEDAALAAEMGAWGKGSRGGKEVKVYNPVLLKDKKTGEMFTEEELEKKKERDEREKYEAEFERKERKRKDRDGDRDRERRKHRDDEESDGEYYRRKEKEKERRRREDERDRGERRERDRDRDRDREDRHRRHRDGDRDRDRDRRRDRDDRDRHRERGRRR